MRPWLLVAVVVAGVALGCGEDPPAGPSSNGENAAADSPGRTKAAVERILVGAWDFDQRYANGEAIPCVRVFSEEGTGYQFDVESGETAGKRTFQWTVSDDGGSVLLAYGPSMKVNYRIDSLADDAFTMTATTSHALPEEHRRR